MALGEVVLRGADCLIAALQECTAESGLNEARYRVLAVLHASPAEESSQAELAASLLQSESNLSTLLERMSGDGLIVRRRCEKDRRRSLIRLAPTGVHALSRARRLRAQAIDRLLESLSPSDIESACTKLSQVVGRIERALSGQAGAARRAGAQAASAAPFRMARHRD